MIKALQTAAAIAVGFALLVGFGYALNAGVNRAERAECIKWQEQARQFAGFYLTSWQAAQCEHHGINVWQAVQCEHHDINVWQTKKN